MAENIKVAVRVRPFNSREKKRGAQLIVQMDGKTTSLLNPENLKSPPRKFTFDHSYWSHDGYKEGAKGYLEPDKRKYADQNRVFADLGVPMLENAWQGYNCSIFAYGQTGSGKSYSIVGHGANHALVPRVCERLFRDIESRRDPGIHYEVTFSMLEIYNENVRDLLNTTKTKRKLAVRERPDKGFHVEGLTLRPVGSYDDIRLRMSEGERNRTIAATKMNETSSRAHTIVAIQFAQNEMKTKTTKQSVINLVDLAGSERVKQTEAEGDRFREAQNINQSLLTLGNVLKALCEKSKGKQSVIPYRNSVLTKLLKNALGGNSKTVMIAAISPDAENYDQTMSTLRYADRAKSIKTVATVNTEATDKLIQELIQERERLLRELQAKDAGAGTDPEELRRLREEHENEIKRHKAQMVDMKSAWDDELEKVRKEMKDMQEEETRKEEEEKKTPHLINLNEDPALCGKLNHMLKPGISNLGNGKQDTTPDIVLNGPRVVPKHSLIMVKNDKVFLEPKLGLVLHNGKEITASVQLRHQDRIRFGSNNLFVFNHPGEAEQLIKSGKALREITFEFAQDEIAKCQGLNMENEDAVLREEVMSIMQLVQDVNAIAEDMGKQVTFNIVLVSAAARGLEEGGRTEMYVRMYDLENQNEYLWNRNKFLIRQSHMQEMYNQFEETGIYQNVEKEKDPFWEPADTVVTIGVVPVPLNYIAHQVEFDEDPLTIIDYRARHIGFLKVEFSPCNSKGKEDDTLITEDPMDLVGKSLAFKIKIIQGMNLPDKFTKTWCRYKFYEEGTYEMTQKVPGSNPQYQHERLLRLPGTQVTHKFIDYLVDKSLAIELMGQQADTAETSGTGEKASSRQRRQDLQAENAKLQAKLDEIAKIVGDKPDSSKLKAIKKILKG